MTAQDIELRDIIDDAVSTSKFYHGDTILDLKKRFAEEQGYGDEYQHITFYGLCIELPDEKLVRDQANTEEGISFSIDCGCMHHYIWVVRNGKWNKLFEGEEYFLDVGKERKILKSESSFGEFAIVRNRYVIVVLHETLLSSLLLSNY